MAIGRKKSRKTMKKEKNSGVSREQGGQGDGDFVLLSKEEPGDRDNVPCEAMMLIFFLRSKKMTVGRSNCHLFDE